MKYAVKLIEDNEESWAGEPDTANGGALYCERKKRRVISRSEAVEIIRNDRRYFEKNGYDNIKLTLIRIGSSKLAKAIAFVENEIETAKENRRDAADDGDFANALRDEVSIDTLKHIVSEFRRIEAL